MASKLYGQVLAGTMDHAWVMTHEKELLQRYLPPPPAIILDVGGAAGAYAFWLAEMGYVVHLIDAVPHHIEQAREDAKQFQDFPLASINVGDARQLEALRALGYTGAKKEPGQARPPAKKREDG